MTSELSIFAAQLREFISFQAEEPTFGVPLSGGPVAEHSDAEFNGYAMVLFAQQFKANAPYRRFCEARGVTPQTATHWTQIPAVPTTAFKELELTCLSPEKRTHVFYSSGTTEQKPSRHFHSAESITVYEASLWPWFVQHVLNSSPFTIHHSQPVILTPPPSQAPHSSLVHMFDTVRRKLGATESSFLGSVDGDGAWTLDVDGTLAALNSTLNPQPSTLLLGTAFSFVHLLDFLNENNVQVTLSPGSRVMETGGYKGQSRSLSRTDLHALITKHLGIPSSHIVCEYGMSELSSQAYDTVVEDEGRERGRRGTASRITHHASRIFHFPPWARAQVISPETGREVAEGETGLMRVFDLANVFSVMTIQTDDLAIRRGDGFELLGRAERAELRGCSLMSV
jgi:hypothetical protein